MVLIGQELGLWHIDIKLQMATLALDFKISVGGDNLAVL